MFKSNDSIKFYLFHILVVSILVYIWSAVAYSNIRFADGREIMTVSKHVEALYRYGGIHTVFYDPLLTFTIPPLTLCIFIFLRRGKYFMAHLCLLLLLALMICEMDWYLIKEPTGKIFLFSYLGLLEYSVRIMLAFIFQGVILYETKKALSY